MNFAIVTDSTCDLRQQELDALRVYRVPLYVTFKGEVYKDWLEISPHKIIEGVAEGADLPTTSQPSPQDFEEIYRAAAAEGAEQILCLTISSELSGTYQSANLAKESAGVPVSVFDSRAASVGLGDMVRKAAELRAQGASLEKTLAAMEQIRDSNFVLFTVASLDFLQKGGRIGRAQALVGSLLNIKPILSLKEGKIEPVGRVRGTKKALQELVARAQQQAKGYSGRPKVTFLHIQDEDAAKAMREALVASELEFTDGGVYEIGAVIAAHVGPGTFGLYMHDEPDEGPGAPQPR